MSLTNSWLRPRKTSKLSVLDRKLVVCISEKNGICFFSYTHGIDSRYASGRFDAIILLPLFGDVMFEGIVSCTYFRFLYFRFIYLLKSDGTLWEKIDLKFLGGGDVTLSLLFSCVETYFKQWIFVFLENIREVSLDDVGVYSTKIPIKTQLTSYHIDCQVN